MAQYPVAAEVVCTCDITKFLRDTGPGSYTVTLGEGAKQNASYPAANAFDGVTAYGSTNRVLLAKDKGEPMQFIYTIPDSVYPGYGFTVYSMTLFRLRGDNASDCDRSPKAFTLEALDGTEWKTLLSVDSQTWDSSTYVKCYDIPVADRGEYRSYRFTITENNDQWWGGMQEIAFTGLVTPNLVWNGTAGARWNAADANWIDGLGAATNWIPGAMATFGAGDSTAVTVEGTQEVSRIVFSATNSCTISGGSFVLSSPEEIKAGADAVIGSDIVVDSQQTSLLSATERLPADPSNTYRGLWTLLWRNRNLAGITNFTATLDQGGTSWPGAKIYHYNNNGDTASVQFQYMKDASSALLCVKVIFEQNGPDVWARADYARYSWDTGRAYGDDMDSAALSFEIRDGRLVTKNQAYGLYNIQAFGGETAVPTPLPVSVACGDSAIVASSRVDSYLPRSETDSKTGDAVVCFPGCSLAGFEGIQSAQFAQGNSLRNSTIHYFTNNGTTASVQIHAIYDVGASGKARLCVKVEFSEDNGDVCARAVYAKFDWSDSTLHDFDDVPAGVQHSTDIRDDTNTSGYGVKNLVGIFKGRRVVLNGEVQSAGGISVGEGATLTLGASAISLDHDIAGEGMVRFVPAAGSQTVTVAGERSIGRLAFGGVTTLSFTEGASLSAGSADIDAAAAVSLVGSTNTNLLRIGTAKCLTHEQRSHFTVNGYDASQDEYGWIVPKPGMAMVIR